MEENKERKITNRDIVVFTVGTVLTEILLLRVRKEKEPED